MLHYGGLAGSDGAAPGADDDGSAAARRASAVAAAQAKGARLQVWRHDGAHAVGAPFAFESLDPEGPGPGSLHAFVSACRGEAYEVGAGPVEGLKAVAAIDALYRSIRSGSPEPVAGCEGLSGRGAVAETMAQSKVPLIHNMPREQPMADQDHKTLTARCA